MKYYLVALFALILACAMVFAHPSPVENQVQVPSADNIRPQRHLAVNGYLPDDHVDFGAHTGDNGAFGWYADFPVQGEQ